MTATSPWNKAKNPTQAWRCAAGTASPSHMKTGNSTDVMRPIDSRPPIAIGGSIVPTISTAYGKPSRR